MAVIEGVKPLKGWMTVPMAADELGMSKQGVHRAIETGRLPANSIGPFVVVRESAVRAFKRERAERQETA